MLTYFIGGFFFGLIVGLGFGVAFFRDKIVQVRTLDDETTSELMTLLDLAEDDNHAS
jgi:hypothetical protein